jgi:hypothetical protein
VVVEFLFNKENWHPDVAGDLAPAAGVVIMQAIPVDFADDKDCMTWEDLTGPETSPEVLAVTFEGTKLLVQAQERSQSKAAVLLPSVPSAQYARLERCTSMMDWPNRCCYYSYLIALHITKCKRFSKVITADLKKAGAVPFSAPFKSLDRINAKIFSEYSNGPLPYMHRVTDILRMGAEVKDHADLANVLRKFNAMHPFRKFKNRLVKPTHDVLTVFEWEGIMVEVQFSFKSINLMKKFAHTAYDMFRIKLDQDGAAEAILATVFEGVPMDGPFFVGGYETLRPEKIVLKPILF